MTKIPRRQPPPEIASTSMINFDGHWMKLDEIGTETSMNAWLSPLERPFKC